MKPKLLRLRDLEEASDELYRLRTSGLVEVYNQWDLPQILDHCSESLEFSLRGFPEYKPLLFRRTIGTVVKHVFLWQGQMHHNTLEPIPGSDSAQPHSISSEEAFARLFNNIQAFKTYNQALAEHFAYGKATKQELEKLQAFHIADHLSKLSY